MRRKNSSGSPGRWRLCDRQCQMWEHRAPAAKARRGVRVSGPVLNTCGDAVKQRHEGHPPCLPQFPKQPRRKSCLLSVSPVPVIQKGQRNTVSHIPASVASSQPSQLCNSEGDTSGSKSPRLQSTNEIQVPLSPHMRLSEPLLPHQKWEWCLLPQGLLGEGPEMVDDKRPLQPPQPSRSLWPRDFHPSGTRGSNQTPSGWVGGSSHLSWGLGF